MAYSETFPLTYRHQVTGEPVGLHHQPLSWLSHLGLTDEHGTPLNRTGSDQLIDRYGIRAFSSNPNPTMTVVSDSGDPDYDKDAVYLAKHAIQLGRPLWGFPQGTRLEETAPWPRTLVSQAASALRGMTEAKVSLDTPEPATEPDDRWIEQHYATESCPYCGDDVQKGAEICPRCGHNLMHHWEDPYVDEDRGGFEDYFASIRKEAPGKEHMKGVSPKRNRQYEHIKEQLMESGKSEEEAKEEAARTVNKQRAEHGETKSSDKKHWIQDAVKKPGQLHKDLGVPEGEKIPADKLEEAEHSDSKKVRERAQFAENMKKIKSKWHVASPADFAPNGIGSDKWHTADYPANPGNSDFSQPYGSWDNPATWADSDLDVAECPQCGGPAMELGKLGKLTHYRCRNCGNDFHDNGRGHQFYDQGDDEPNGLGPQWQSSVAPKWHFAETSMEPFGGIQDDASFDVSQSSPEQEAMYQKAVNYAVQLLNQGLEDRVIADQIAKDFPQLNAWYVINQAKAEPVQPEAAPQQQPQAVAPDADMQGSETAPPPAGVMSHTLVDKYEDIYGRKIARVRTADGKVREMDESDIEEHNQVAVDPTQAIKAFVENLPELENKASSIKARIDNLKTVIRMCRENMPKVAYSKQRYLDEVLSNAQLGLLNLNDYLSRLVPDEAMRYAMDQPEYRHDAFGIESELTADDNPDVDRFRQIIEEHPALVVSNMDDKTRTDEGAVRSAAAAYISQHIWELPPHKRAQLTSQFVEAAVSKASVFEDGDEVVEQEEEDLADHDGNSTQLFM